MAPLDPKLRRREFLQALGAAAAAGGISCGPDEGDDTATEPGSIEHIVLVMMENRTFDHFLGALSLEEGREIDGLTSEHKNPGPSGDVFPARMSHDCLPDPPHSWDSSHRQFNDGAMDGFVTEYLRRHGTADPRWVMGYHNREDLPVTYAMADQYAVCTRWFCSIMTSTWPNRLYATAGTSDGRRDNGREGLVEGFDMRTIFGELQDAGIEWAAYSSNASTLWLYEETRGQEGLKSIDHFFAHCDNGTLPAVSWVEPAFGINDDHPPVHPLFGQLFMASVHNALAQSPLWNKCLLVFYYDEHGGFYDHVPPPKAADDRASEGFDQLGCRVPAIVCGPWVKSGAVDTVFDHASPLAHIEREYGVGPLTARTEAANDLWSCIDLDRMAAGHPMAPAELPPITMSEAEIEQQCEDATRRRSLMQPMLEEFLDAVPAPKHLDRRGDEDAVFQEFLAYARRYGALI